MNLTTARLGATYDLTGVLVHRPSKQTFGGPSFGDITILTWGAGTTDTTKPALTATGFELAESILIAQKHVLHVQKAIDNMQRILDTAEPIKEHTCSNTRT
jgi:hypothetical protein